jgi:glycerophosphoryl diester phosphodiesterase
MMTADLFSQALDDFRRGWKELLSADLIYKAIDFVFLVPLIGVALRFFVSTSGGSALADQDILFFVLSPVGLVALVVMSTVTLAVVALEQACLMTIGMAATDNAKVSAWEALSFGARRSGSVILIALRIVLRILLIAAPFLLAGGLVYLALLTEFDINYYLSEKPPTFWIAAVVISVLLLVMSIVLVRRLIGWTFSLPLHLFEKMGPAEALRTSHERTNGHRWTIFWVMAGWLVFTVILSALGLGAVRLLGQWFLPSLTDSIALLAVTMGGLALLWGAANLIVGVVSAAAFALLIVRLYDRLGRSQDVELAWAEIGDQTRLSKRWSLSTKTVLAGLAVAAVAAAIIGGLVVDSIRLEDDVLVIAHRGAAGAAPENTLASVERAIADGTDIVEIDVQETADGEVVVLHDSDLMKVGGVDLKIWDATYEQLQDIDIGSWFSPEFSSERVPKLEQVLELCKDKAHVDIELKYYGHDERLEERVVEIVERTGMESQIVVMSLKYEAIQKMRKLRPDWTLGLLTAKAVGDLTRLDADFLAVHTGLVRRSFVRAAHNRGKEVFAWTVNDPIQMSAMISKGVDSLITDEPALAKAVLKRRAEMNPVERLMLSLSLYFGVTPKQPGPETDLS